MFFYLFWGQFYCASFYYILSAIKDAFYEVVFFSCYQFMSTTQSIAYFRYLAHSSVSPQRMKLNRSEYQGAADKFPKWRIAGGRILAGLVQLDDQREARIQRSLNATIVAR